MDGVKLSEHKFISFDRLAFSHSLPGLPDFTWYIQYTNMEKNYQNYHNIYQMAINQTNILHCKALQNIYPNCAFWSENIPSGNPCAYLPGWRNVQSVESPSSLDNVNCCNNGQILFLFVFLIRGGNCAHERNCESREKRESYNRRTYNMFYYIMPTYIKCR
jgi:hypothetical protein